MANLYMCGFDDLDTASFAEEWDVASFGTIVASGRTGVNALQVASNVGTPQKVVTASPKSTLIVSMAFNPGASLPSEAPFLRLGDAAQIHVALSIVGNALRARRDGGGSGGWASGSTGTILGTSGSVFTTNTWHWVSALITRSSTVGVVNVWVNGVQVLNLTGQNTDAAGGGGDFTIVALCARDASNPHLFDDVIIDDSTGTTNTTIRPDSRVDFHLPNADGTTSGWTPSTGATQFGVIDETAPNDDTDYLSGVTLNAVSTVNIQDFKNSGGTLTALQITAHVKKAAVGSCGVSAVLRRSGTDNVAAEVLPGTSYRAANWNYDTFPGGAALSEVGFNAIEVGLKKTT